MRSQDRYNATLMSLICLIFTHLDLTYARTVVAKTSREDSLVNAQTDLLSQPTDKTVKTLMNAKIPKFVRHLVKND